MVDEFEMPDLGDLNDQIEDAMNEAQKALEDIPDITSLGDMMGSLSSLMENMPDQMGALSQALSGFGEQHAENIASLVGDPDWEVKAEIKIGQILHLYITAEFDLRKIEETWDSTQGAGFEEIVGGVVSDAEIDLEDGMFGQIMGQLKQGRGTARVMNIDVASCRIQGAPGDAAETLELSPEGNIPLVLNEAGIGFEFAPVLTIKNDWENAAIPTFSPMAEDVVVPISSIASQAGGLMNFKPGNQETEIEIGLQFNLLK